MKPLKNAEIETLIGNDKSRFLITQYLGSSNGRVYLVDKDHPSRTIARVTRRIFAKYDTEFVDRPALNLQIFKFV